MWLPIALLCSLALHANADPEPEGAACAKYQAAFNHSCYEFVKHERSFQSAESWCERGGGHLAFIQDEETQGFLQRQVPEDREWWIGLAWNTLSYNETDEGSMAWLDSSNVSYSNWHNGEPPIGSSAKCGYILKHSGYRWGATENCSQEFYFICEFESGQAIACDYYNATAQCESGQVIQISDSFYGRKTSHFCTLEITSEHESMEECSWISVKDQVAGQCHGLQACQVAADAALFGDPCPTLGNYLSITYQCMEGLKLTLTDQCLVSENVTINLKWLLTPYSGNLSCTISTGDGNTIDPYHPQNLSSSVTHRFSAPGQFTIFVECTTSEWHVAAQKTVTVRGNTDKVDIVGCYNARESQDSAHCRTLYGETLWIQVLLNGGKDVNCSVSAGNVTLVDFFARRGMEPHNVTLDNATQQLLGPGIHQLTIRASSNVTTEEVSEALTVHLVEPVSGLQATLASQTVEVGTELQVNVSVTHGAPVELKFEITGFNGTFYHLEKSAGREPRVYGVPVRVEGSFLLKLLAVNAYSNVSVDVGNITVRASNSSVSPDSQGKSRGGNGKDGDQRRYMIHIEPRRHVDPFTSLTLRWTEDLNSNFTWSCGSCWPRWSECVEQQLIHINREELKIPSVCLPPPNSAVTLKALVKTSEQKDREEEQCLYVTAKVELRPVISCEKNCKPVNTNEDMIFSVNCEKCTGAMYNWYLDNNFPKKTSPLSPVCSLPGFRPSSLSLLQSNSSTLTLNSSFLKDQEVAFRIKVTVLNMNNYGEEVYVVSTLSSLVAPVCTVTPEEGSVLTSFKISCSAACIPADSCPPLSYCFYPRPNSLLHCGSDSEVLSVYLPLGEEKNKFVLNITVTVSNNLGDIVRTIATVKVKNEDLNSGNQTLLSVVSEKANTVLKGEDSGTSLIQLYKSVSSVLNHRSQEESLNTSLRTDTKKELREAMLVTLSAVNVTSMETALEMSEVLKEITHKSEELSATAQVEASGTLKDVSEMLLSVSSEDGEGDQRRKDATGYLFNAVNNVLEATLKNGTDETVGSGTTQSLVSHQLLSTVDNLQSALLIGKLPDQQPMVLTAPSLAMYINRLQTDSLDGTSVSVTSTSSASFTLPSLATVSVPGESDAIVDLRMVSFALNPFSSSNGFEISGAVGGLSLTSAEGSVIPVTDLKEHIEIILPRASVPQEDRSLLNLGNFSALQINVTSSNASLVIHLELEWEIPLMLYLGYGYHPNETSYDVKTHLPNKQFTGDEGHTWVLSPEELLYGEGTYYLTVRHDPEEDLPNKDNITLAITCFTSQCVFWDELHSNWSSAGCHVGPKTTPRSTQCLCTHLTFFGSSFFVMPNAIDVSKTAELFATFVDNPVVVTTVGCIFVLYVLIAIWARRKDIQDNAKVQITVLEDNDPFAQYRYLVTIFTGHRRGAATTSKVTLTLYGSEGESEPHHLYDPDKSVFERGGTDIFLLTTLFPLGDLQRIRLWHDNSGDNPSWYVNRVLVHDPALDQKWYFLCNSWLSIDVGECVLDKVFTTATEQDLKQFSNLFFLKTTQGFRDSHIWYSVFSRSPRSSFTRVQRVSCCFSLLLCTMLTSIMFWGVPMDPAEQKMDLGKIEFTWQEVMIGFESSILMFPINLLIVQIFRNVRLRQSKEQTEKKQGKSGRVSPNVPPAPQNTLSVSLTPEAVIKDIKRIGNSLFKTLKTPLPPSKVDFGKSTDINQLLALVEDIICQQNRAGQEFYDESKKKEEHLILSLGSVDLKEKSRSPTPTPEKGASEKLRRSEHSRYLYLQLQHVEKELELLGPRKFQNPQSYSQAVRQVQHMKGLLESRVFSGSASERCSSTPSLSGESKKDTPAKGLPWWFVFVGWSLVAATSSVSGFFTMLYGLHYGKDGSIKWLISMAISFFESLFITQPLKVLGFAAFFALVLKKVEHEDGDERTIDGPLSGLGDSNILFGTRRDSDNNIYQPPPPTDIEKMKNIYMKEQKVFALIREILAYLGFLWMLLLVAYGQRDPNSYYLNKHLESSFTNGLQDVYSYQDFFTWANTTLIKNLYGSYPGFVTDGNSKLVGGARIRQVRVKMDSCRIAHVLQNSIKECHAAYSLETEDRSDYVEHWNVSDATNNSSSSSPAWRYQSQSKLRGHPIWGKVAMYRGGGYVVHLENNARNASRTLQELYNNVWLDTYTRAVFVEFTVYNANVNLFCIIRIMFESNALGAFFTHSELQSVRLYPYTDGLHIFVVAAEVIYFLFITYYMVAQGKLMKRLKWSYFRSKWNLLELAIILISWSALSVFVKRTILGTRDISYYQKHKNEYVNFNETATADAILGYLIAFLVLLSTVKLWHLLRLNPKLNMITSTLRRAWGDISGFITVILIMFLAYSTAANLIFGWKLYSYKTLFDSAETMVSLQLGIFNYEEVLDYNPILGSFLIGSCIIFMTFVVLNLFISVILVAFSEEQKHYQASEEEEIVDLMLMKICSFLGVKYKKEENAPHDDNVKASSANTDE
ncbi:polycystic kidney disease protein 1-like 2 [Rhinatrema bivittatum]|uniref:polycystic kidney disease protein 1-like 2 n=1 Tax=Rhinatrema bivittatum TaxID=194408 RepID=UPI001125C645|nr:polycystic kidney disease protein 1-like 2 [Rhinatrema bivittatum]